MLETGVIRMVIAKLFQMQVGAELNAQKNQNWRKPFAEQKQCQCSAKNVYSGLGVGLCTVYSTAYSYGTSAYRDGTGPT